MIDKTEYRSRIGSISLWKSELYKIMEFQLKSKNNEKLLQAIEYREQHLTQEDRNIASAYLNLGIFSGYEENFRIACFCICLESEFAREENKQIQSCSQYTGEEAIFKNESILSERRDDLINYRIFNREEACNIFSIGDKWGYFDRRLPIQVYEWLDNCFSQNPCWIRVEPNDLYDNKPKQLILECLIIPPQFKWWKQLNIYKGTTSGSVYELLGNDIKGNYNDYYDYNILNIRRLEVSESRKNSDNISMMIEELEYHHCAVDPNQSYLIGRMIHLDSDAKIGTNFKDAKLNHLDLAFNLYLNDKANERLSEYLCNGKTVDADHRTHILRIENIPFESLFKFAYSFFRSKTLTSEWLANEFTE